MDPAPDITQIMPSVRRLVGIVRRAHPFADEEDLSQVGFVGLLEAASRYDAGRGASLSTFGGRRAVGAMRDHVRDVLTERRKVPTTPIDRDDDSQDPRPLVAPDRRSAESREMVLRFGRFLRAAWTDLPDPPREVIRQRYLEGASVRDVARALGVSIATVARRERAGLDWLRERFRECGYGRHLDD